MIVNKAFKTFLHHPMHLVDLVCARLPQIPEHELLRWPWYRTPGVLVQYGKVLQDWLVIRNKTKDGNIQGLLPSTLSDLKSGGS